MGTRLNCKKSKQKSKSLVHVKKIIQPFVRLVDLVLRFCGTEMGVLLIHSVDEFKHCCLLFLSYMLRCHTLTLKGSQYVVLPVSDTASMFEEFMMFLL